jgi:competence protein ComEC
VRTPAALPSAALLAGVCVGALEVAGLERGAAVAVLIAAWLAAARSIGSRPRCFAVACAVGFLGAGALVGQRAVERALQPTLLAVLDRDPTWRAGSRSREPIVVEGTLRADAVLTPSGVSLSLRVHRVGSADGWTSVDGGALVSVAGAEGARAWPEWTAGRHLRMPATLRLPATYWNPGVRDARRALALGGTIVVGSVKSARLVEVIRSGSWLEETAAKVRTLVRQAVTRTVGRWSRRSGAIVTAILIGDRAALDADVERRLQEAGTYHVMAISGGNIAILAGAVMLLVAICGLRGRPACLVSIAALLAYAGLVGGGASVVRATIMAVAYLLSRVFDHRAPPLNAVAIALLIALLSDPTSIFDAGLALTFGATLGILAGARLVARWLPAHRLVRPVAAMFAASLAADLVVLPIGLYAFSQLALGGPFMNFIAIPMMALAQIAGLVAVVLVAVQRLGAGGAIVEPIALAAGYAAHVGATVLVESTEALRIAPWLARRIPPPALAALVIYFVGLAVWVVSKAGARPAAASGSRRRWVTRCAAIQTVSAAMWMVSAHPGPHALAAGRLSVVFLDVGQGDAALVRFPAGGSLLVDAGGAPGAHRFDFGSRVVVPAVWARGVTRLDRLAVSHGDPDHIGGGPGVVRDLRPRELWEGIEVPAHAPSADLRAQVSSMGGSIRTLARGWSADVDGVSVLVAHPARADWERPRVRNDDSLVIELRWRAVSILLTGDIGREAESELGPLLGPSRLRVLKVPHHGSRTSSSAAFLEAAMPAVAVVSVGRDNRYGHPADDVLAGYDLVGTRVFRTDRDGAVTVTTDGAEVVVETYRGETVTFTVSGRPPWPSPTPVRAPRETDPRDAGHRRQATVR